MKDKDPIKASTKEIFHNITCIIDHGSIVLGFSIMVLGSLFQYWYFFTILNSEFQINSPLNFTYVSGYAQDISEYISMGSGT